MNNEHLPQTGVSRDETAKIADLTDEFGFPSRRDLGRGVGSVALILAVANPMSSQTHRAEANNGMPARQATVLPASAEPGLPSRTNSSELLQSGRACIVNPNNWNEAILTVYVDGVKFQKIWRPTRPIIKFAGKKTQSGRVSFKGKTFNYTAEYNIVRYGSNPKTRLTCHLHSIDCTLQS